MSCGSALAPACPNCRTELPAEAKFCFSCGHQLGAAVATPAPEEKPEPAEVRLDQYIPAELLDKLKSARTAGGMQGERRVITMLFCDVQGSTAAAEGLDPEEWAEIMNGAFEHLIAPVYRYEGTLARLMGDAVLAFFGAPIAHEDDPQRAVLAALDIVREIGPYREEVERKWGLYFNVRVGINTGLVVVGEVGSDLRVEYTALGDAVNLAARMEQTAAVGTVRITENTHKLVAPLFRVEDLGTVEVKGKREPVAAYRVIEPLISPGSLRGIEGLDSPLIGRDSEVRSLTEAVGELRRGQGQILSVMGEAGLGKSRLVAELHHALEADGLLNGASPAALAWLEGRSLSYQTSTPYAPFVDLFSRYFDLNGDQRGPDAYEALNGRVAELLPDTFEEVSPFMGTLLRVPPTGEAAERVRYLQPPQVREMVFRATQQIVESIAKVVPLVLVFEDVHWIDPTSLELLEQMMAITDRASLMLVGIFRPWRQEPSWHFHETASRDYPHRYTSVALSPLDQDHSRELVANLLHVEDLPEQVRALILQKAEGNPFFVEEVIRSLLDAGLVVRDEGRWRATREIVNIAVPDTLAGVITARLDRLDDESKRVVQTASVIGREFSLDTLSEVHGAADGLSEALVDLQRRELIRERTRIPERQYVFKHVMTQDTAYDSLLMSRRREFHGRVAEYLERKSPDSVSDIARHFIEARQEARALPYLVEAGNVAARAYATADAIGAYRQALDLLEDTDDLPLARRAYEGLGGALTFAFDVRSAVESYHKMFHVAEEHDDLPMQVSALNKLGFVTALMMGQAPEAEEHLVDAERLAHQSGDAAGLAEMHMTYCYIRSTKGDFEDAEDHLGEAARIGRELDLEEPRLFGLTHTANTMIYMTRFEEAWEATQEAIKEAEAAGNRKYLAELKAQTVPHYHIRNGDLEAARESAQEGIDLGSPIGAMEEVAAGELALGQIAWLRGEYEGAIACQQRALEAARLTGMSYLQAAALCQLGATFLDVSLDFSSQVAEYHTEAMKLLEMPMGTSMATLSWADLGFCAMELGDLDTANEMYRKGLDTPTILIHLLEPRLLGGLAHLALAQSKAEEAARFTSRARGLVEAAGMRDYYPWIAFTDARVSAARGDPEAALGEFLRAEELALEMGMRPLVWQSRAGAARTLSVMGRAEEARERERETLAAIDKIAELFDDDRMRNLFIDGAASRLRMTFEWEDAAALSR